MKSNKKQILVCEEIISQASFWISTNDISSPTHSCDISEMMRNHVVFNDLTDEEASELETKLNDLYYFVRSLKVV
jgi:hypothetical protein